MSSGCYYHKNAPCCFIGYYSFNEDRSTYMIGPVFCCCVCCCPCPAGCCGNQNAVSQGSSVYKGDAGVDDGSRQRSSHAQALTVTGTLPTSSAEWAARSPLCSEFEGRRTERMFWACFFAAQMLK